MINFYCVTLETNKHIIKTNLYKLKKFYDNFSYTIITTEESCKSFSTLESNFNCNIVNEKSLISKSHFESLILLSTSRKRGNKEIYIDKERINWYYQQVLKLSFLIDNAKILPTTLIDADTILLKKIPFFSKGKSIVYSTPYEKNKLYLDTSNTIFKTKVKYKYWVSCVSQIMSLSPYEISSLIKNLEEFKKKDEKDSTSEWIAKLIIKAVLDTHNSISGSLFSEMDLIAFFLINNLGYKPKKILFLRNEIEFMLNKNQEDFVSFLGFKHVTYEDWLMKSGFYPWHKLIKKLIKYIIKFFTFRHNL